MIAEVLKLEREPVKFVCPELGEVALNGVVNHRVQPHLCAKWNRGVCDYCQDLGTTHQLDLLEREEHGRP